MQHANKDLLYLLRILEAIGKIILYSKEYNTADDFIFSNDQRDYNASLLLMMRIGEQASKISVDTKDKFPEIEWQHIKQQLQNGIFNKEEIEISRNSVFYLHIDFSK